MLRGSPRESTDATNVHQRARPARTGTAALYLSSGEGRVKRQDSPLAGTRRCRQTMRKIVFCKKNINLTRCWRTLYEPSSKTPGIGGRNSLKMGSIVLYTKPMSQLITIMILGFGGQILWSQINLLYEAKKEWFSILPNIYSLKAI